MEVAFRRTTGGVLEMCQRKFSLSAACRCDNKHFLPCQVDDLAPGLLSDSYLGVLFRVDSGIGILDVS